MKKQRAPLPDDRGAVPPALDGQSPADTALAPKIVYSTEMSADMVNRFPGAITFIDASLVTKGLKVVKIDGRAPGDKGYALH